MGDQARLVRLPDGTEVWARLSSSVLPGADAPGGGDDGDHYGGGDYGGAFGGGGRGYGDDGDYGDYEDVGALDGAAARVLRLRELITGVAASVRDAARRAGPDEVSVEFGVEFAVKAGAVVSVLADAQGTSGLKVTLTWRDRFAGSRPAEPPVPRVPSAPPDRPAPPMPAAQPTVPPPARPAPGGGTDG